MASDTQRGERLIILPDVHAGDPDATSHFRRLAELLRDPDVKVVPAPGDVVATPHR